MTASSPSAARAAVDQLEELLAVATPGPWIADGSEVYELCPGTTDVPGGWIGETCRVDSDLLGPGDADAALIVALRNLAPHLLAAIKAVDELHQPWYWGEDGKVVVGQGMDPNPDHYTRCICASYPGLWPCPTAKALRAALALAAVDVTETADGAS